MGYFAKENVNKGRQPEIDCLKAFCIVCMILLHTYEDLATEPAGPLYAFLDFACIFLGAGAFMICMGIGMRYSRNQTPKNYALRGFEILTVGQLLNLARNALPNLIAWWIKGEQIFIANSLLVIQVDILSFAGIAFMLLALLKKLRVPDAAILLLGLVMNVIGLPLYKAMKSPSNFLLSQLLGYFVLTDAESYFPLCAYFFFVAFGYFIGGLYPRIADKKGLSTRVLLIGLPVCVAYYALRMNGLIPFMPTFGSDIAYVLNPGPDAVASCLASLVALAAFYKLTDLAGGKLPGFVAHLSRNINQYYCVSYLFILPVQTILIAARGSLMPGLLLPTLYGFFVLAACRFVIDWNDKYLHFGIVKLKNPKRAAAFIAIWVATVAVVIYAYPRIEVFATSWNNYLLP